MINPVNIMKMLGERKSFVNNHLELIDYLLTEFGTTMEKGTVLEIKVEKPDGSISQSKAKIQEGDEKLLEAVKSVVHDIRG